VFVSNRQCKTATPELADVVANIGVRLGASQHRSGDDISPLGFEGATRFQSLLRMLPDEHARNISRLACSFAYARAHFMSKACAPN